MHILRILAKAKSIAEATMMVPECTRVFLDYAAALERHEVPATELAFTTNLSKGPDEYTSKTIQRSAMKQLLAGGAQLHAGEGIRYVITDYRGASRRAMPVEMFGDFVAYDAGRYIELLAETCSSVLEPFSPSCSGVGLRALYKTSRNIPLA
jgi:DNA polymerase-2